MKCWTYNAWFNNCLCRWLRHQKLCQCEPKSLSWRFSREKGMVDGSEILRTTCACVCVCGKYYFNYMVLFILVGARMSLVKVKWREMCLKGSFLNIFHRNPGGWSVPSTNQWPSLGQIKVQTLIVLASKMVYFECAFSCWWLTCQHN